jgi:hypothetical protein
LRVASYVSLGVGVVGLAVGTGFAIRAAQRNDEALSLCRTVDSGAGFQTCTDENERSQWSRARDELDSARTLSQVGFVTGAVGLATGAVLFLVSGRDELPPPAKQLALEPVIGPSFVGVTGRF